MPKKLLQVKNLKKYYKDGQVKALDDVTLDIYEGEVLGLLGVNGAGKTTLSSLLVTLNPPTSGDVLFEGESIYKNINEYRRIIGFCPQKANLISDLTVKQNLYFSGRFFGLDHKTIKERMEKYVQDYKLSKYLNFKPDDLSGGYKQRVLIARALIHNPKLVIFDEPTVGLDPHVRHQLWEDIRDLKKKNVTVILTTHYMDEAEMLSDRICILDKGKIKLIDTPKNLMSSYQKSKIEDVFLQLINEETVEG